MSDKICDLLKNRNIIKILEGDIDFGYLKINGVESDIKISMPYLTGPMICDIANLFGFNLIYDSRSRWIYFDELLNYCNNNTKTS